jgi:hypothetical protein
MPDHASLSDIVMRLRAMAGPRQPNTLTEAADLIEQMAEELDHKAAEATHA